MKLNDTHKLLIYADDVTILGGSVHAIKNTEALSVDSMEIRLQVNADKTKYLRMNRDQNAGRCHYIQRLIIVLLKGWNSFGNNLNKSKLYSGRN